MEAEIHFPNITSTLQVTGCLFGEKPAGWTYPVHHHHLFELLYCQTGEVTLNIKQSVVRLETGDWLLIRPGVRHGLRNEAGGSYRFFNMHFDVDDRDVRRLLARDPFAHIPKGRVQHQGLLNQLEQLERLVQAQPMTAAQDEVVRIVKLPYEDVLAVQAYILLLIREWIALQASEQPLNPTAHENTMAGEISFYEADTAHRIEELLNLDIHGGEVSVASIAGKLGMSRSQCTKVFTKVYGLSPRQYISTLKLKEAKELLVRTNLTIESIAKQLGFGSASHFSRQFRRWTGVSPNRYRPKHSTSAEAQPSTDPQ
ncbi:helix-turn-helix domain-containing protein [Paenibacillus sp. HJGM_3]|uniref:helix-turn-helix domain-containing protein n=1 Tax=Paenibacillus sp. HJGM_3 TaxID=3379816 RepID=UPI003858C11B